MTSVASASTTPCALALENNLDLQVDRISPQIQDLTIAQARTGYTPIFQSNIDWNDQTQPPASLLAGNASQIVGNNSRYDFGVGALNKWGGTYNVGFNNARATTNNLFTNFNPQLDSNISLSYTQPLLRNFKIDGTRQQILVVAEEPRHLRRAAASVDRAHRPERASNAYYDLMFAIGNLNVQRQSLDLAQQSLKDNRARVEIGTMAPIDIVQAEAEVAQREESVILAEARDLAGRGPAARARLQPVVARLLAAANRADRAGSVPSDDGGHRRRGGERP